MIVRGGRGGIIGCTYIQPWFKLCKHSTSGLSSLRPGDFSCANSVRNALREVVQRAPKMWCLDSRGAWSEHSGTPSPTGNVTLEEGGELFRARKYTFYLI